MKKMYNRFIGVYGLWLTAILFLLMSQAANSQSFNPPANIDPGAGSVEVTDEISFDLQNIQGMVEGNRIHFYYVPAGDGALTPEGWINVTTANRILKSRVITADDVAAQPFDLDDFFTGNLNEEVGTTWHLFVGAFTNGRLDHKTVLDESHIVAIEGNNPGTWEFDQNGQRYLQTTTFNLSGINPAVLEVELELDGVGAGFPVEVQYSSDGTTWTTFKDALDDPIQFTGTGTFTPSFDLVGLTPSATTANTRFRVRQVNANAIPSGQTWEVNSIELYKGDPIDPLNLGAGFNFVGQYEVVAPFEPGPPTPSFSVLTLEDTDGILIGAAYPADDIVVKLTGHVDYNFSTNLPRWAVVNQDYIDSQGEEGLRFEIEELTIAPDDDITPTVQDITITVTVPHNIAEYDENMNLRVLYAETGTTIDFGEGGLDRNLFTFYDADDLNIVGGLKTGNTLRFDQTGQRHFTSPGQNIETHVDSYIEFDLRRVSVTAPPPGTEIVVEYSVDEGGSWTEIIEVSLSIGTVFENYVEDMTADMVSENTIFRARQKNAFLDEDDHTWEISDFVVFVPGEPANFVESPPFVNFQIWAPTFNLSQKNPDAAVHVGDEVVFELTGVDGKFPDGTIFELYFQDAGSDDYLLKDKRIIVPVEDQEFAVKIPFIQGFNYLFMRAEGVGGFITESGTGFFIQPVSVQIDAITYIDPITDGGVEKTSPGKSIAVDYTVNGQYDIANIDVVLEYEHGTVWYELDRGIPAAATGTLEGTLPFMDLGDNIDIRVRLVGEDIGYENDVIERDDDTYEVGPYDVAEGSRFAFQIHGNVSVAQNIFVEYSTDGDNWEVLGTKAVTQGFEGFLFHYADDLYDVPVTGNVWFRPGQDGPDGSIVGVIIGHRLEKPLDLPVDAATDNIQLVNPSVTVGNLQVINDIEQFVYGEDYTIEYVTNGLWPDDTWFAFVFERNGKYLVLAETEEQGEELVSFTVPLKHELWDYFDLDDADNQNFPLTVYAYSRENYNDLRLDPGAIEINYGDLLETSGESKLWDGEWRMKFEGNDDRYAITKAYDLSGYAEPIALQFEYQADITIASLQTLPKVQVSIDNGATYTTLEITQEGLDYAHLNRLEKSTAGFIYQVGIPAEYLTEATYFRWIQEVNSGDWSIVVEDNNVPPIATTSISLTAETNQILFYDELGVPQTLVLTLDEFDCDAYDNSLGTAYNWELIDNDIDPLLDPVVEAGAEFDFELTYVPGGDPSFPAATQFSFLLKLAGGIVDDPFVMNPDDTEQMIIFGPFTAVDDTVFQTVVMPAIETGLYDVWAAAFYEYVEDGEEMFCAWDTVMVDQGVLVINEIAKEFFRIELDPLVAVNEDEEDDAFYFGGQIEVRYETFGPFEVDVRFGVVLEGEDDQGGMVYHNLGSQPDPGKITDTLDIPSKEDLEMAGFDLGEDVFVKIYAYVADAEGEELMIAQIVEHSLTDLDNDFLAMNNGEGDASLTFDKEDEVSPGVYQKRFAVTRSLKYYLGEDVVLNDHRLSFTYAEILPIAPITKQTLPRLQVSEDSGATFDDLEMLFDDGTYHVALTQEWLDDAAKVHFRWIQEYPAGEWELSSIMLVSGESNLLEETVSLVPAAGRQINLVEDAFIVSFTNYELIVGVGEEDGLEPPVYVGEVTQFNWAVIDVDYSAKIWPDGTMFRFSLKDVEDPETEEDYIIALVEDDGEFMVELPDFIETGIYDVNIWAFIGLDTDAVDFDYYDLDTWEYDHVHPAVIADTVIKTLLVINQLEEDVRKIVVNDLPNEDPLTLPEFDIGEEFDVTFDIFGQWPEGTKFAAALEQLDALDNFLERVVLEEVSSEPGSVTVEMPAFVHENENFAKFRVKVYAYSGPAIDFGESVPVYFDEDLGGMYDGADVTLDADDNITKLVFNKDGDRYALSEALDLSIFEGIGARLSFDYEAADILVNPGTLPRVMASIDAGETFVYLAIDTEISDFGAKGYLLDDDGGAPITISVEIPDSLITEATHVLFLQEINRGEDPARDVWSIANVEVVGADNRVPNYLEENNDQEVELNQFDIANYEWMIVRDEDGFEPALYSGSTFLFTWAVELDEEGDPVGLNFPEGTEFSFFMKDYPETGEIFLMETVAVDGDTLEFTLPQDIKRKDYEVLIHVELDDFVFVDIEDELQVGTISIFNPLLVTHYTQQEVLYAGNTSSFTAEIENNVAPLNEDWYYNLVMIDGAEEWLLAAQLGSVDFTDVAIPPFKSANDFKFEIRASIDGPVGVEGQLIEDVSETLWANLVITAAQQGSRVTHHKEEDLTTWPYIEFDVEMADIEVTDLQKLVLEYSVNGGVSYTSISTYPNAMFELDELDDKYKYSELIELPEEARAEEAIIRFRIEEFKEAVTLKNVRLIDFVEYTPAPMAYKDAEVFIARQRIDITATDAVAYCNQGVIEISYAIRGQFGAENVMTLHSDAGGLLIDGKPITFEGITHGTGTVTLDLALLDNLLTGADVKFRLRADDETVEDYEFFVTGAWSEVGVEILDDIPASTAIYAQSLWQTNHLSCNDVERIAVIRNVKDHFSYQLRNFETGELIGGAVVADPDDEDLLDPDVYPVYNPAGVGILEIMLGAIDEKTIVEVVVNARDASGDLVCDELIPNMRATFDVRPVYTLHYDLNSTNVWTPVVDGQEFVICDGSLDLRLRMGYWKDGSFTTGNAKYYRDLLTTPLGTYSTYNNFVRGGTYFAVYEDMECGDHQSVSVVVTVNEKPEQPVITVDGETSLCEDGTTVLTADEGYAYYRWTRNWGTFNAGNTRSVTVSDGGTYRVEVSNVPFDQNCHSVVSDPVYVEVFEFNNVWFPTSTVRLCPDGDGIAEVTVSGLQHGVTYYLVDDATDEVFGEPFSAPTWSVTFHTAPVDVSTSFNVLAVSDENADCSKIVSDNTLKVVVLPVYHTLVNNGTYWEVPGEDPYCEGVQLGIGEEDGTTGIAAGSVRWYKDGFEVSTSWWYTANEPGVYQARYKFDDDCWYYTEEVEISERPERPVLTYEGSPEFCEGEGDLVLIAPEGYEMYTWYRNGSQMQNVSTGDTHLNVVRSGDYQVMVSDMLGCGSPRSLPVNAIMHDKPDRPTFMVVDNILCEPGVASLLITNPWGNEDVMYQIYDVATGMPSGNARISSSNLYLESDVLSEDAILEVRAWRVDVEGCGAVSLPFDIKVYDLNILISGNNLIASVPSAEAASYQWYRDGIMIRNNGDKQILAVYDEAEYSVVVVTYDGCILESVANTKGDLVLDRIISEPFETSLYPNPAQDNLFIRLEGEYTGKLTFKIVNLAGATVYEATAEKTEAILRKDIPVSDLTQGVYMLQITGSDYFEVNQFIKK